MTRVTDRYFRYERWEPNPNDPEQVRLRRRMDLEARFRRTRQDCPTCQMIRRNVEKTMANPWRGSTALCAACQTELKRLKGLI